MIKNNRSVTVFLILGLCPALFAKDLELKKKAGDYEVSIRIDKNPPILGLNRIEVEIEDASGEPVTDAKVLINYYMPPMPRMAPMNYKVEARRKGDRYEEKMKFIMAGPWIIAVKITRGGKTTTAKFNIDAR